MKHVSRRWVLRLVVLLLVGGIAFVARPLQHLLRVAWRDVSPDQPLPDGVLDDASRMSGTEIETLVAVRDQSDLVEGFRTANEADIPVAVAGERLSMGAQSLIGGGMVLDMGGYNLVRYKPEDEVAVVGAGATWGAVLEELDRHGRSPAYAPSLSDASVGGTLSVNAYGWQVGRPPIAAGVRELLVMLTDGALWRCSRTENADLFSAVLGGYGLIAVLVEVTLDTVANRACDMDSTLVAAGDLAAFLGQCAEDEAVEMASARLTVVPGELFERAAVTVIRPTDGRPGSLRSWDDGWLRQTARKGALGDDYGKWLDWQLHARFSSFTMPGSLSRNSVFNRPARAMLPEGDPGATVLLTVFVPPEGLARWLNQARLILADYDSEILDASVHFIGRDPDAILNYAPRSLYAVRLSIHDTRRPSGEYRVRELTMRLIDRAIELGGGFFLPYRRHASQMQFLRVYGNLARFNRLKRRYDPDARLKTAFSRSYLEP